jgi:hypothetical protein
MVGNGKTDKSKDLVGNRQTTYLRLSFQPRFVSKAVPASKLENTNAEVPEIMPVPDPSLRVLCNSQPWPVSGVC